jgi:hypothetical protein
MASLRGFGQGMLNALEIAGAGPAGLLQRQHLSQERDQDEMRLAEFISQHPQDFDTVSKLAGPLKINLEKYRPSIDDLLAPERAKIAKDPNTTTPPQILRDLKSTGVDTSPVMGQTARFPSGPSNDIMSVEGNGTLPSTQYGPTQRPAIQDLLSQRTENLASQDADVKRKLGITQDTARAESLGQAQGHAQGVHEAAPQSLADLVTQRQTIDPLDIAKATAEAGGTAGASFDATHTPQRMAAEARGAGLNAGATAAAQQPYRNPDILYDQEGNAHAFKFSPSGSAEVTLPPGMGKQPVKLSQSQVENVASLNMAETEGVKVLASLHKLGLDQSNDPADPRWNKFVVGTLGMAPGDWDRADIQQRTAFINAILMRSLLQGRPNQYIAELIQQHLPQGTQTGMQLNHVLHNVLGQAAERRAEIGSLTRSKVPGPTSGMTFDQWQQFENGGFESGPQQESFYKLQQLRQDHGGR